MAKFYDHLTDDLQDFIRRQHIFFVATAPLSADGHVNLSPKGYDTLRVLDAHTIAYLDITGSGTETAAHIMENERITMMWTAFEGSPNILRAYGRGEIVLPGSDRWDELIGAFNPVLGVRQMIVNHVTKVQTSCGFGVPFFDYVGERDALDKVAITKGEDGLAAYRREKNTRSIDGLPTPFGDS